MSDKQGKKRKKQFYKQAFHKKGRWAHALDAEMRGFLITCNNRERDAVREAYNLFNEYADKLYGPEQNAEKAKASSDEEDDIEAALEKEVSELKTKKKSERRFQQVESGANNCIFIKTTLPDPTELVNSIFSDIYESEAAKSRYIMRLLPVIGTCKCNEEKIKKMAEETLAAHFTDAVGHTFSINVKVRNNNTMNRKVLIPMLVDVIKELNPANNPDLDHPEYVVNVDVMRTVLCLSVLKDFTKYRKYNLQEVASAKSAPPKAVAQGTAPKDETKEEASESTADKKEENQDSENSAQKDQGGKDEVEKVDTENGSKEAKENDESKEPVGENTNGATIDDIDKVDNKETKDGDIVEKPEDETEATE